MDARVTQVVTTTDLTISDLLTADPLPEACPNDFHLEQRKDAKLKQICEYLENGILSRCDRDAKKITSQSMYFQIIDHVLYFIDPRRKDCRRVAVPRHLQEKILHENHGGVMAGSLLREPPLRDAKQEMVVEGSLQACHKLLQELPSVQWCLAPVNDKNHSYNLSKWVGHSKLWELI